LEKKRRAPHFKTQRIVSGRWTVSSRFPGRTGKVREQEEQSGALKLWWGAREWARTSVKPIWCAQVAPLGEG